MTQEEKELRLVDLCARLPYGVICQVDDGAAGLNDGKLVEIDISKEHVIFDADYYWDAYIDDVKAYLRPLSSMTKEEKKYIKDKCSFTTMRPIGGNFVLVMPVIATEWLIDFYNSHHLDWRGLIEKGLALEAEEGIYNLKN